MSQLKIFIRKAGKGTGILFSIFCFLILVIETLAQNAEWKYIARSEEGRYFIKSKIDRLDSGNSAMWMKIVADDGSEQLSYTEWDCKDRRFRLKQTSSYAPDGTAIEQLKDLDWAYVTPETVSESLFAEACGNPSQIKYAVIILKEVKLRDAPNTSGQVYRTVKRNESFPLTPFDPVGAWYQIYDPVTLAEYWVHGNGIKLVSDRVKNIRSKKTNRKKSRR